MNTPEILSLAAVQAQPWREAFARHERSERIAMRARGVCPSCGEREADGHLSDCAEHPKHALFDDFAQAVQGDLSARPVFVSARDWSKDATVADVLADALSDEQTFLRRAMVILANAAAGRGIQRDAQALIEEAGRAWAERNAQ